MGMFAALLGLFGCDQQKVDEAMKKAGDTARGVWNSVKPDSQLFKGIEIGRSTEDDIRRQAGKPEIVWEESDGGRRLEYPRGPEGGTTWMVTIGPDNTVRGIEQVLTAENFARVRPGMSQDAVRRMLGKPTRIEKFALKQEEVWGYRWHETPTDRAFFNVHFNPQGTVTTTSRSDDPSRQQGG
ncbi:outer membrane protein assembly factor BamE domain-containing protein [Cupriavidus plantarum]|uniref:outer membrane protein assembly factor BamE domain-containing protein n=1 Tax=Cupriavidus plantarum TaxID=942865 RepID=UPI000EAF5128|nr:outer membrane protein assembly factor BamE [Cupriavidus plantarum]